MTKKSFMNPALQFISQPQETTSEPIAQQVVSEVKPKAKPRKQSQTSSIVIAKSEAKSERAQLLLTPSLKENLNTIKSKHGISFNDLVHQVLNDFVSKELS